MIRNSFGFPVVDSRLRAAQEKAAEVRARNFPHACTCAECIRARNLPAVQRILAAHKALHG
jgi:hypothetical protein